MKLGIVKNSAITRLTNGSSSFAFLNGRRVDSLRILRWSKRGDDGQGELFQVPVRKRKRQSEKAQRMEEFLAAASSSSTETSVLLWDSPNVNLFCGGCAFIPPLAYRDFLRCIAKDIVSAHLAVSSSSSSSSATACQVEEMYRMFYSEVCPSHPDYFPVRRFSNDFDIKNKNGPISDTDIVLIVRFIQGLLREYYRTCPKEMINLTCIVSSNSHKRVAKRASDVLVTLHKEEKDFPKTNTFYSIPPHLESVVIHDIEEEEKPKLKITMTVPQQPQPQPQRSKSNIKTLQDCQQEDKQEEEFIEMSQPGGPSGVETTNPTSSSLPVVQEDPSLLHKSGLHLVFPFLFVTKEQCQQLIYDEQEQFLIEFGQRPNGCNDWKHVIDEGVPVSGMRLNGSRKAEDCDCHKKSNSSNDTNRNFPREDCPKCHGCGKFDKGADTCYWVKAVFDNDGTFNQEQTQYLQDRTNLQAMEAMIMSTCQWVPFFQGPTNELLRLEPTPGYTIPEQHPRFTPNAWTTSSSKSKTKTTLKMELQKHMTPAEWSLNEERYGKRNLTRGQEFGPETSVFQACAKFLFRNMPDCYQKHKKQMKFTRLISYKGSHTWSMLTRSNWCQHIQRDHLHQHIYFEFSFPPHMDCPVAVQRCWDKQECGNSAFGSPMRLTASEEDQHLKELLGFQKPSTGVSTTIQQQQQHLLKSRMQSDPHKHSLKDYFTHLTPSSSSSTTTTTTHTMPLTAAEIMPLPQLVTGPPPPSLPPLLHQKHHTNLEAKKLELIPAFARGAADTGFLFQLLDRKKSKHMVATLPKKTNNDSSCLQTSETNHVQCI